MARCSRKGGSGWRCEREAVADRKMCQHCLGVETRKQRRRWVMSPDEMRVYTREKLRRARCLDQWLRELLVENAALRAELSAVRNPSRGK